MKRSLATLMTTAFLTLIAAGTAGAEITTISAYFDSSFAANPVATSSGTIPFQVKCFGDESCSGSVDATATISGSSETVGTGSFYHSTGNTAESEITLTSAAITALKSGDLAVKACAETTQVAGRSCDSVTLKGDSSTSTAPSTSTPSSSSGSVAMSIGKSVKVKKGKFKVSVANGTSTAFTGVVVVTAKLGGQFGSKQTTIGSNNITVAASATGSLTFPLTSAVKKLLKKKKKFSGKACVGASTSALTCTSFTLKK